MKYLAYTAPDYQGELITIYEALRRRESDPDHWEGRIYYDIIRSRPMVAVKRLGKSSFSFQGGAGGGHRRGSKGIAHELAQEFLCKQTLFKFNLFNKSFIATVETADDEARIVDPNNPNRVAYVDVMLSLAQSCPMRERFGDRIAIEITDTHENSRRKKMLFKDLKIGAIEVRIPTDWQSRSSSFRQPTSIFKW